MQSPCRILCDSLHTLVITTPTDGSAGKLDTSKLRPDSGAILGRILTQTLHSFNCNLGLGRVLRLLYQALCASHTKGACRFRNQLLQANIMKVGCNLLLAADALHVAITSCHCWIPRSDCDVCALWHQTIVCLVTLVCSV